MVAGEVIGMKVKEPAFEGPHVIGVFGTMLYHKLSGFFDLCHTRKIMETWGPNVRAYTLEVYAPAIMMVGQKLEPALDGLHVTPEAHILDIVLRYPQLAELVSKGNGRNGKVNVCDVGRCQFHDGFTSR
jgi:hypothetical protein